MMLSAAADPVYTVFFVSIRGCISMPSTDQRTQAYHSCIGCFSSSSHLRIPTMKVGKASGYEASVATCYLLCHSALK